MIIHLYFSDFPDHNSARIVLAESALIASTDVASYKAALEKEREHVKKLADSTANVVVIIMRMPAWLSTSSDSSPVGDAGWKEYQAHSPKDYAKWRELMQITGTFFAGFPQTHVYYEVWNEPDLFSWKESSDAYLRLYKETATALRKADPQGKIGGAGLNGWNGKLVSDTENLNVKLISFTRQENLPLDFISWHFFDLDTQNITKAKEVYLDAVLKNGYTKIPEFIISEWNAPEEFRGTAYSAAMESETLLTFYENHIGQQMTAAWEDFNPHPNGLSDYGLVTQSGIKKPVYYVQKFFDEVARAEGGIAVVKNKNTRTVAGKEKDGCYSFLFWNYVESPIITAFNYLLEKGVTREALVNVYGSNKDKLMEDIRLGRAANHVWDKEFSEAGDIYSKTERLASTENMYTFLLPHANRWGVRDAAAVKNEVREVPVQVAGDTVALVLSANEVAHIRLCETR